MPKLPEITTVLEILLKPTHPSKGPPLPDAWDVSWPGFFTRSIKRLMTEGPSAPWKTIREKGLIEELKREIELVTGRKLA